MSGDQSGGSTSSTADETSRGRNVAAALYGTILAIAAGPCVLVSQIRSKAAEGVRLASKDVFPDLHSYVQTKVSVACSSISRN